MNRHEIAVSVLTLMCLCAGYTLAVPAQAVPPVTKSVKKVASPVTLPSTDTSGVNIFSVPGEEHTVATFVPSDEPRMRGQGRRRGLGNGRSDIPNLNQLKSLPSLSMQQRRQVVDLIKSVKTQNQPLQQQLQKMQANKGGGNLDAASRRTAMQIRNQLQTKQKETLEKLKSILSAQQFAELEAMKRGELAPATFAAPMTGGNRFAAQAKRQRTASSGDPMKQIEE